MPGEDEDEMTILHEGGKVVCIEGESLWVVLRLSNGSSRLSSKTLALLFCATGRLAHFWGVDYGNSRTPLHLTVDNKGSVAPTFAYKKWSLLNQDLLVDVVSCGKTQKS